MLVRLNVGPFTPFSVRTQIEKFTIRKFSS